MKKNIVIIFMAIFIFFCSCTQPKATNFTEAVKNIVIDVYGKPNDPSIQRIGGVTDGGKIIINLDNVLELNKFDIYDKTIQIMQHVPQAYADFPSDDDIGFQFRGSVVDTYGNAEFKPILQLCISKDTALRTNWDNIYTKTLEPLLSDLNVNEVLPDNLSDY
ncbi:hypothetical protein LJC56_10050 [Christensenellaceae bacterium OttesenSCG-928-K19]|nr:hypothetical protein [Christensenellaceae bacterium OttesenSCG-928-K19]